MSIVREDCRPLVLWALGKLFFSFKELDKLPSVEEDPINQYNFRIHSFTLNLLSRMSRITMCEDGIIFIEQRQHFKFNPPLFSVKTSIIYVLQNLQLWALRTMKHFQFTALKNEKSCICNPHTLQTDKCLCRRACSSKINTRRIRHTKIDAL